MLKMSGRRLGLPVSSKGSFWTPLNRLAKLFTTYERTFPLTRRMVAIKALTGVMQCVQAKPTKMGFQTFFFSCRQLPWQQLGLFFKHIGESQTSRLIKFDANLEHRLGRTYFKRENLCNIWFHVCGFFFLKVKTWVKIWLLKMRKYGFDLDVPAEFVS